MDYRTYCLQCHSTDHTTRSHSFRNWRVYGRDGSPHPMDLPDPNVASPEISMEESLVTVLPHSVSAILGLVPESPSLMGTNTMSDLSAPSLFQGTTPEKENIPPHYVVDTMDTGDISLALEDSDTDMMTSYPPSANSYSNTVKTIQYALSDSAHIGSTDKETHNPICSPISPAKNMSTNKIPHNPDDPNSILSYTSLALASKSIATTEPPRFGPFGQKKTVRRRLPMTLPDRIKRRAPTAVGTPLQEVPLSPDPFTAKREVFPRQRLGDPCPDTAGFKGLTVVETEEDRKRRVQFTLQMLFNSVSGTQITKNIQNKNMYKYKSPDSKTNLFSVCMQFALFTHIFLYLCVSMCFASISGPLLCDTKRPEFLNLPNILDCNAPIPRSKTQYQRIGIILYEKDYFYNKSRTHTTCYYRATSIFTGSRYQNSFISDNNDIFVTFDTNSFIRNCSLKLIISREGIVFKFFVLTRYNKNTIPSENSTLLATLNTKSGRNIKNIQNTVSSKLSPFLDSDTHYNTVSRSDTGNTVLSRHRNAPPRIRKSRFLHETVAAYKLRLQYSCNRYKLAASTIRKRILAYPSLYLRRMLSRDTISAIIHKDKIEIHKCIALQENQFRFLKFNHSCYKDIPIFVDRNESNKLSGTCFLNPVTHIIVYNATPYPCNKVIRIPYTTNNTVRIYYGNSGYTRKASPSEMLSFLRYQPKVYFTPTRAYRMLMLRWTTSYNDINHYKVNTDQSTLSSIYITAIIVGIVTISLLTLSVFAFIYCPKLYMRYNVPTQTTSTVIFDIKNARIGFPNTPNEIPSSSNSLTTLNTLGTVESECLIPNIENHTFETNQSLAHQIPSESQICCMITINGKQLSVQGKINNFLCSMVIDSGSSASIVPRHIARTCTDISLPRTSNNTKANKPSNSKNPTQAHCANGAIMEFSTYMVAKIELGSIKENYSFLIPDTETNFLILGTDFLQCHTPLYIDFAEQFLTLGIKGTIDPQNKIPFALNDIVPLGFDLASGQLPEIELLPTAQTQNPVVIDHAYASTTTLPPINTLLNRSKNHNLKQVTSLLAWYTQNVYNFMPAIEAILRSPIPASPIYWSPECDLARSNLVRQMTLMLREPLLRASEQLREQIRIRDSVQPLPTYSQSTQDQTVPVKKRKVNVTETTPKN